MFERQISPEVHPLLELLCQQNPKEIGISFVCMETPTGVNCWIKWDFAPVRERMGKLRQGGVVSSSATLHAVIEFHVELGAPRQPKLELRLKQVLRLQVAWVRRNVELVEFDFAGRDD